MATTAHPLAMVPYVGGGRGGGGDALQDFRDDVRMWMELDSSIRTLQTTLKERRAAHKRLSDRILQFMASHNIEDIDARDGNVLRYKVHYVRTPLRHINIKERISRLFANSMNALTLTQAVTQAIFGNRDRLEKVALKRLAAAQEPHPT